MNDLRKIYKFTLFMLIAFLLASFPAAAFAHEIEPTSSQPEPGQALAASPVEVVLIFPEELAEEGSTLAVMDASGKVVDLGSGGVDLNDPNHATLRVKLPQLSEGVYEVHWEIILTDGDAVSGSYHFGVGNVIVPTEAPESEEEMNHAEGEIAQTGQSSTPSSSLAVFAWAGGFLVILIAVAVFYFARRRS